MKKLVVILVLALVISNGYWIYKTIDNAVALHYAIDSANFTAKALEQAIYVANLNVLGTSADEALVKLTPDVYGLEPFEKEGCINAGQICLELDENRVVTGVR